MEPITKFDGVGVRFRDGERLVFGHSSACATPRRPSG